MRAHFDELGEFPAPSSIHVEFFASTEAVRDVEYCRSRASDVAACVVLLAPLPSTSLEELPD